MEVSETKSYYAYLASTSETVVNYFGNSKWGLALQIFTWGFGPSILSPGSLD